MFALFLALYVIVAPISSGKEQYDDGARRVLAHMLRTSVDWVQSLPGQVNPFYVRDTLKMKGVKHFVEMLGLLEMAVNADHGDEVSRDGLSAYNDC